MKNKRKKRIRIINKAKFTLFCIVSIFAFSMAFSGLLNGVMAKTAARETATVVVQQGDTLWKIASENNPGNKDIRKLVHEIIDCNELTSATIFENQCLNIPLG